MIELNGIVVDDSLDNDFVESLGEPLIYPSKVKNLLAEQNGQDIDISINSYGGSVYAGAEIFSALQDYAGKVTMTITGVAASIASVIAMAADELVMTPMSSMIIHNPMGMPNSFSLNDVKSQADILEKIADQIADTYSNKCGQPKKKIRSMMDKETYLSADDAINMGFADKKCKPKKAEMVLQNSIGGTPDHLQSVIKERTLAQMDKKKSLFERILGVSNEIEEEVKTDEEVPATEDEKEEVEEVAEAIEKETETETVEGSDEEASDEEIEQVLDQAATRIEELEAENAKLVEENASLQSKVKESTEEVETQKAENKKLKNNVNSKLKTLNSLLNQAAKAEKSPTKSAGNSEWTYNGLKTGGNE